MIPKDVIKRLRRIQITTSRKVTDVFAGQYQSVFKGAGMEFSEVREYNPGDEIRSIDWNVTARMGHPFIKKFVEERELTIMVLLDVSMSCRFGTRNRAKSDLAAELCSVVAFSAIKNNDKVGMLTFTDRVEKFVPPRKGVKHVLRVVREALYNKPVARGTDINNVLEYLNRVTKRRTITFIVSDFIAPDFKKLLSVTNKRHDVIAVTITDPAELELPEAGVVRMHDAETMEPYVIDTSHPSIREYYRNHSKRFSVRRGRLFRSVNVDSIDLRTDRSYMEPLMRFFRMRERRMFRG
ncbi:MAG: DUF58 domain-containing protein [Candidatus Omnitrophica bacterium]|nr:DUF58 domain-containing protein [Candidatus Omnitrophota bacterium]MBU1128400.1 DUF58 domain-containing protein [Candidatus Omnitrophota bacterium]MBU1656763.1 DUF58 domain-containing protein [Candidatus Omnitrophota bacterium]MBU1784162.1 DUF58 domain-containing protein [Candidatus Omnitrophota bacterium]MBU1851076.1 DUF58 domain-containing protein [Candidatus Omnitrophota bacterium]